MTGVSLAEETMGFDLKESLATFMVLFAVIDITGSIPIIVDIKSKVGKVEAGKATLVSFSIMLAFLVIGEPLLGFFGVDIYSFAIAGSFILFFLAIEMVLGIQLFRHEASGAGSIVPIAFPLIAGAGSITTLLSLRASYQWINILIGLLANMVIVYLVLKATHWFERLLGPTGLYILQKFFGIILMAIAIHLFISNTGIDLTHGR